MMEYKLENPLSDMAGETGETYENDLLSRFEKAVDMEGRQAAYLLSLLSE